MPTAGTSVSAKSYRNSSNITDRWPVVSLRAKSSLPHMSSIRNFGDSPGSEPERLREYAQWEGSGDPAAGLDFDKLHAELQGKLAREKGFAAWLRSRPTPVRALLAGLAVGLLAVATMALWIRPDFELYPPGRMNAVLASIAALIVLDLILVLWPIQLPAVPRWLMAAAVAGAPIGLFFWYSAPVAHLTHARSVPPEDFKGWFVHAVRCLGYGSIIAAGIYALLRSLDRGGTNRVLLMAACAGLAANLVLQLHCPQTAPAHLMIGHLGVVALCFGFAFWRERVTGEA